MRRPKLNSNRIEIELGSTAPFHHCMKSKAVRTSCIESASVDCIETALKVHQKITWSSLNLEPPYVIILETRGALQFGFGPGLGFVEFKSRFL